MHIRRVVFYVKFIFGSLRYMHTIKLNSYTSQFLSMKLYLGITVFEIIRDFAIKCFNWFKLDFHKDYKYYLE